MLLFVTIDSNHQISTIDYFAEALNITKTRLQSWQ